MTGSTLPAFHETEKQSFTVELEQRLATALGRYKAYYKQLHDGDVSEEQLLAEMARHVLDSDKQFQKFLKKGGSQNGDLPPQLPQAARAPHGGR